MELGSTSIAPHERVRVGAYLELGLDGAAAGSDLLLIVLVRLGHLIADGLEVRLVDVELVRPRALVRVQPLLALAEGEAGEGEVRVYLVHVAELVGVHLELR